jgi:hypothetical protein
MRLFSLLSHEGTKTQRHFIKIFSLYAFAPSRQKRNAGSASFFFCFAITSLFLFSCTNEGSKPDVSNIKTEVTLQRFDRDLFSIDTNNIEASLTNLNKKYPSFLPLYFEYLSPVNFIVRQQGSTYSQAVREYFRNIKPLYDATSERFGNMDKIKKELEQDLRYVKYYFPSFKVPAVFTSVESLNPENPTEIYGTTYFRDTLVISLQMFLGNDFNAYDPSQYFDYIRRRFEPQYIAPNSIRAIANTLYADSSQGATLIEQMIEKGKQWYLADRFLPDVPDSIKTFYTKKQLDWCQENEGNIWGYLTKNADLYTVDPATIQNYIGEGPFTQGMPDVSPGNIGQWVGWQIVKKFAEKNDKLTLQQVLATPAKKIFQESKYKPK